MNLLRTVALWVATAFRANPYLASLICVTTMISTTLAPLSVYGVKLVIDAATEQTSFWPGVGVTAGSLLLATVASAISGPVGDTLDDQVRRYVHHDLLRLTTGIGSIAHHESPEMADRIALVERDAPNLNGVFQLLGLIATFTGSATVVVLLWSVSPLITPLLVVALLPAVIASVGMYRVHRLWDVNERHRRLGRSVVDTLADPLQGVEVRCFGLSRVLLDVARRSLDARRIPWVAMTRRFAALEGFGWLLFGAGYVLAVLWVLERARNGALSVGDVALVLLIGPQVSASAQGLAFNLASIVGTVQIFGRYHWLRDYAAGHGWIDSTDEPPARLVDGIRLNGVSFAYPSTPSPTLDGVDLHLPAGTVVALVGENGAGKSTVVKLLARLYDPTAGRILVDGVPLTDLDPEAWRRRISAGFQDFASLEFLLADSVGVGDVSPDPVGTPGVGRRDRPAWAGSDRERVVQAVTTGHADAVVAGLTGGLDTQLGRQFDGGAGLSGGQWQRLALARAFMRDDPLLMLLDEPTAALDPEAEAAIYDNYAVVARDLARRTGAVTVIVSHRFSTVRMADLIVVMADGHVRETGTHEELMATGGRYAALFDQQARTYR